MKKSILTAAIMAVILVATAISQNAQRPAKITNPGAIAEFGFCAANDSTCESGNRVRQDIAGSPYVNGVNGVNAVFNLVSGSRDLTIGLNLSQRSVHFDFRVATSTGSQPAWWFTAPQQNVKPYFNVLGAYYAKEQCGSAPICDNNYVTRMNAGLWSVSGDNASYALLWNPEATTRPVNSPSPTVHVNVHYVKDGSGEVFTITPLPNLSGQSVSGLESTVRKSVTGAGQYDMPFTLTVRLQ